MAQLFKTKLIGQEHIGEIFNKILQENNIPHIFITAPYGSGKTTLLKEFISTYYKINNIKNTSEYILNLSSEKDRGIICIRKNVTEFVHHSSEKPGIYRWILIDDADSLPIISQQALRRPMETHAHTTRFFFCSRYPSDLIPPLKSRCLHLEIETISTIDYVHYYYNTNNLKFNIDSVGISFLISLAHSPSQMESMLKILHVYYLNKETITVSDINLLFGSPSYSFTLDIINAFVKKRNHELIQLFFKIWSTGISYEDFLYELNTNIKQIGILKPKTSQKLYKMIMKGWIQYAQGKTHSFDMLRLISGISS
jgi:DNA polymerase III delta prime subunit